MGPVRRALAPPAMRCKVGLVWNRSPQQGLTDKVGHARTGWQQPILGDGCFRNYQQHLTISWWILASQSGVLRSSFFLLTPSHSTFFHKQGHQENVMTWMLVLLIFPSKSSIKATPCLLSTTNATTKHLVWNAKSPARVIEAISSLDDRLQNSVVACAVPHSSLCLSHWIYTSCVASTSVALRRSQRIVTLSWPGWSSAFSHYKNRGFIA